MIKKIARYTLIVAFSLSTILVLAKTVYKSKDAQGNVIFSDTPQTLNAKPITLNDDPVSTPPHTNTAKKSKKENTDQDVPPPPEDPARKERIRKACENYQRNLEMLNETGRRVYSVDEQGEYHYYSDEERQKKVETLQQNIKDNCQGAEVE